MASRDHCIALLGSELKLTPKELTKVADFVEKLKANSEARGLDFEAEFGRVIGESIKQVKIKEAQTIASVNKLNQARLFAFQDAFKNDPLKGVESLLTTLNEKYKGKGNTERLAGQVKNRALNFLAVTLRKHPELHKRLKNGDKTLSKEIHMAMHPPEGVQLKLTPGVEEIAMAGKKMFNFLLEQKNRTDFFVEAIPNYSGKQFHPAREIRALGVEKYSQIAVENWDFKRMGVKEGSELDYVAKVYEDILTRDTRTKRPNLDMTQKEAIQPAFVRNLEASRKIHFKDGEAAFKYKEALGGGQNILDDWFKGVDSDAKKIATADIFGINSKHNFDQLIREAMMQPGLTQKQLDSMKNKVRLLEDMFDLAGGRTTKPQKNMIAKFAQVTRMWTDMAKLKTALFTTLTDFSYSAGIMSGVNKTSFLTETFTSLSRAFDTMPILGKMRREEFASELSVFIDDIVGFSNARFYEESGALGMYSKMHRFSMEMTGLPAQAHGQRVANAVRASELIAKNVELPWEKLPQREALAKFGVDEKSWDILRQSVDEITVREGKVRKVITPEKILAVSKSDELAFNFGSYLEDLAEIGSPTPGLKQQVLKSRINDNEMLGALNSFLFQFRSFALANFDTVARIKNEGGTSGLIRTIISATIMGYAALQLKQLAQGRVMAPPSNMKEAMDQLKKAMLQSGAGLLYADFLFAEYDSPFQSVPSMLVGPTLGGLINDAASTFATARGLPFAEDKEKQLKKLGKSGVKFMERNMPSFFMGQVYLNKKLFEATHEIMNPGYTEKKKRILKDRGIMDLF